MESNTNKQQLERGLAHIRQSPRDNGRVELIVRRPAVGEREVIELGEFDLASGLVGDNWLARGYRKTPDGAAHPDMQVNIMNARCIALLAGTRERWPLAGDQLYLDLDLSEANLPAGTVLAIGTARLQITAEPHLGCLKFQQRFGKDAVAFVNSDEGKALKLRGVIARVLQSGVVHTGDTVTRRG